MPYPSASALEAMAECGATAVVLGEEWWQLTASPANAPVDEEAVRRFAAAAHDQGLGCLVSTFPGGDGEERGRWARSLGLDGLIIIQGTAHHGVLAESEADFPALATFEWGRALRRGLGMNGLILVHTDLEGHDLSLGLHADGILYGTERASWRAVRSTLAGAYYGGAGYSTPCPITSTPRNRTPQTMAVAASIGSVPLVTVGYGADRTMYAAGFALPLWQLYRLVGTGPRIEVRTNGVRAAAAASDVDFWTAVYRMSDEAGLVVTANLSAGRDSSGIAVDFASLGFSGEYDVEMVIADDIESFTMSHLGRTANGRLRMSAIPRFGVRGFLFTRGGTPPQIARALDEGLRVAAAFSDRQPPPPVGDLAIEPVTAGLALSWRPSRDNRHVASYRVYRSPDPGFTRPADVVPVGEAHEETSYRDLRVGPGETWSYSVAAVDIAGNEGQPSPAATGTVPSGNPHFSFSDSTELNHFVTLSGAWSHHDSAYGHGCTGREPPFAVTLLAEPEPADVDLGVAIENPWMGLFAGGLVCRMDDQGRGYALLFGGPKPGELSLARVDGRETSTLASVPIPIYYPIGSARTLRFVAAGTRLTGYCDDRVLVEVKDTTHARGRVGLITSGGHVHFDNLTVRQGSGQGSGPRGDSGSAGTDR
jgi:hypothetical protein